jgi:hypothetical protein
VFHLKKRISSDEIVPYFSIFVKANAGATISRRRAWCVGAGALLDGITAIAAGAGTHGADKHKVSAIDPWWSRFPPLLMSNVVVEPRDV